MSAENGRVAAVSPENILQIWRVQPPVWPRIPVHHGSVLSLAYARQGERLAAGTTSGAVLVWDTASDEEQRVGRLFGGVHELSFSPDGQRLAAIGSLGGVTVWSFEDGEDPITLSAETVVEPPLRWSSDGRRLLAQGCDAPDRCAVMVHAIADGRSLVSRIFGRRLRSLAVSPGGSWIIAVRIGPPDALVLYDVRDGLPASTPIFDPQPEEIVAHAFSPLGHGARLVTRNGDALRLWHWDLAAASATLLEQRPVVEAIPDRFATALLVRDRQDDHLWVIDEPLLRPMARLPEDVEWIRLSRDRSYLLVGAPTTAILVHLGSGVRRVFEQVTAPIAWSGGSTLADVQNGSWIRQRIDPTPADPDAFMAWLRDVTDARVDPRDLR
jgi:WD40 repeat protein